MSEQQDKRWAYVQAHPDDPLVKRVLDLNQLHISCPADPAARALLLAVVVELDEVIAGGTE